MEEISIPGWALMIFGAIILPWMIWLTNKVQSNEKEIAVNTSTDKYVGEELKKLYKLIETKGNETKEMFDKMERKFDMFIDYEKSLFKLAVKGFRDQEL